MGVEEGNGDRGGKGRTREQEKCKKRRGVASIPFYSGSGLPSHCQVTVGWSLVRMLTKTACNFIPRGSGTQWTPAYMYMTCMNSYKAHHYTLDIVKQS